MPSMNGRELARRALDIRPDLRVLFMSGYTENGIAGQGGIDDDTPFLQKPFTPETLAGKAREALDRATTRARG